MLKESEWYKSLADALAQTSPLDFRTARLQGDVIEMDEQERKENRSRFGPG